MTTCQMKHCGNPAEPEPVYDANPDPAARRQVGEVAICGPCKDAIEMINAEVRKNR